MRYLKKYKYSFVVLGLILASIFFSLLFGDKIGFIEDKERIIEFIESFEFWAPIILVSIIFLEVIIAPLPGEIMPIAAGFVFGTFWGIFYSWLGNFLGSLAAFYLARFLGLKVVKFFAPKFDYQNYKSEISKQQNIFWILYFLPLAPVDILSFALGLSNIQAKKFAAVVGTAFLIRMSIWNLFGDSLANIIFS